MVLPSIPYMFVLSGLFNTGGLFKTGTLTAGNSPDFHRRHPGGLYTEDPASPGETLIPGHKKVFTPETVGSPAIHRQFIPLSDSTASAAESNRSFYTIRS